MTKLLHSACDKKNIYWFTGWAGLLKRILRECGFSVHESGN